MTATIESPISIAEPITDVIHGVAVTDPFRWLEDQQSQRTREWLCSQNAHATQYFHSLPGRETIRRRTQQLLDVETYDSIIKAGKRYFFKKRRTGEEQPSIYFREGEDAPDQVLIDTSARGTGKYTALVPLHGSLNGNLLLYEVKQGGERSGVFEILDVEARAVLQDSLPHGYLSAFAFAPDGKGFYYVHQLIEEAASPQPRVRYHQIGAPFPEDECIFQSAGNEPSFIILLADSTRIGILVCRRMSSRGTDFYIADWPSHNFKPVVKNVAYDFLPIFGNGRLYAVIGHMAPNRYLVEVTQPYATNSGWPTVVPETDARIEQVAFSEGYLVLSYGRQTSKLIRTFDLAGHQVDEIRHADHETCRLLLGSESIDGLLFERESFVEPPTIFHYSPQRRCEKKWANRCVPFDPTPYDHRRVWFESKDQTPVPMFLVGQKEILNAPRPHPVIMTSYGGFGVSMTPQFSVFVSFMMEQGCIFALPNIRGGGEFGGNWHAAGQRRNRQNAFDDFLAAAEWLIDTGVTSANKLAIFGGSNSGLLVAAAMTQRPQLFCAVICMVPLTDMIRYHLFDYARVWTEEYGSSDNADDFSALLSYSPYHRVSEGVAYPAILIISGDADRHCNSLHARKMAARLQMASSSAHPVLLSYSQYRGHSPVLPLSDRIDALTDRMAFLCDQLQIEIGKEGLP